MIICSTLVITRKYSDYAVFGLLAVVVTQALGYGLIFDLNFFLRNLSVMGGLLMVLSDSWVRKKFAPAGLPSIDEKDRKMYFQFAGRVLLIFLFIGFVFAGDWGIGRVVVSLFGFVACVMVVVGFKAKWSAVMLVVILSIFNILVNNFWTVRWFPVHVLSDDADMRHDSYMNIIHIRISPNTTFSRSYPSCTFLGLPVFNSSITFTTWNILLIFHPSGGLLLLVNMGPGQFSVDEKKKVY